jgi:hypothetical protein
VNVELGASDGSYSRAVVDETRLVNAFRPDLRTIVKKEHFSRIQEKPKTALLWIPNPQTLFSFDGFVELLVHDVLPTQLCRASPKRAHIFSPWRISTFGLP